MSRKFKKNSDTSIHICTNTMFKPTHISKRSIKNKVTLISIETKSERFIGSNLLFNIPVGSVLYVQQNLGYNINYSI